MKSYIVIANIAAAIASVWLTSAPKTTHPALKYGCPDTGRIIERSDYALSYDGRLRSARWTAELVTAVSLRDNAERRNPFKIDPDAPVEFRAEPKDYAGSGFDRGHLAPSANHQRTQRGNDETFYLSNMSPQLPEFNRGVWKLLESHIRTMATSGVYSEIYVFSGPLFLPSGQRVSYAVIGSNQLPVPTHYFKSILFVASSDKLIHIETYILPHREIAKWEPYRVSVDELEHAAGFDLWSELDDKLEAMLESAK